MQQLTRLKILTTSNVALPLQKWRPDSDVALSGVHRSSVSDGPVDGSEWHIEPPPLQLLPSFALPSMHLDAAQWLLYVVLSRAYAMGRPMKVEPL